MKKNWSIREMIKGRAMSAVLAGLCTVLVIGGCHRRPLEDPSEVSYIKVKINTDSIRNVTSDIYNEQLERPVIEPEAMHVIFFEQDKDNVVAETFITDVSYDADGNRYVSGSVSILPGDYRMLVYDYGTETTIVKDFYHYDLAQAYTEAAPYSVLSRFNTKTGEVPNILNEPDHLMVASNPHEIIPYHSGTYTIYADAFTRVESWYLQIKVNGLEYVSSAQAVLSGMVSANYIASDTRVEDPECTIWFKLEKSDDNGVPVICTIFNTFGRIPESQNDLAVTFNIKTSDGRTVSRTFDISNLFLSKLAIEHNWLLIDETITIDPPEQKGGFDPAVDDWDEEHRDIEL
jgi:hypothetical protein